MAELCDRDCNHCPVILHPNSRMLTLVLNEVYVKFGGGVYEIVQRNCPNFTACYDCHIDDFCHMGSCELDGEATAMTNGEEMVTYSEACSILGRDFKRFWRMTIACMNQRHWRPDDPVPYFKKDELVAYVERLDEIREKMVR